MTQAHKVIWPQAGSTWLSLERVAELLENTAIFLEEGRSIPHTSGAFRRAAKELRARHDHSDPCNTKDCPCFALGYKQRAEDREAFFAARNERRRYGTARYGASE